MSDKKLRCALAYRMDPGATVVLAKYDHAAQYETHAGAAATSSDLYGGRDKSYADAVAAVIENDPPSGLSESGTIGGFKVVQSDQHQVVYGADADRICTCAYLCVLLSVCVYVGILVRVVECLMKRLVRLTVSFSFF